MNGHTPNFVNFSLDTAQIGQQLFNHDNLYRVVGDQHSYLLADADFSELYPPDAAPPVSAAVLALATIFQLIENLDDEQAAANTRTRIDWKYALHLPLADLGFDSAVLIDFQQRLVARRASMNQFNQIMQRMVELKLYPHWSVSVGQANGGTTGSGLNLPRGS